MNWRLFLRIREQPTEHQEGKRAAPWAVSDAPSDFIAGQIKGIVGTRFSINRIPGKCKVSQNRPEADRKGVIEGLNASATEAGSNRDSLAMAELVAARRTASTGKRP